LHFAEIVDAKGTAPVDFIIVCAVFLDDVTEVAKSLPRESVRFKGPGPPHGSILRAAKKAQTVDPAIRKNIEADMRHGSEIGNLLRETMEPVSFKFLRQQQDRPVKA
jgi:hypothetical protein